MAHYPKIFDFTGGSSSSIDLTEVAFGTGAGITSSNQFKWDEANQNLLASTGSCINSSTANKSVIIGGASNQMNAQYFSAIIGGLNHIMSQADYSSIIGGSNSCMVQSLSSTILGGRDNQIRQTSKGVFLHGSSILGGTDNSILGNSCGSTIISGSGSTITDSNNSVILGGSGLSLSNEDSVVHVSRLKIATASNVNASRLLVWDTDNYVKWRDASSISGSGGTGSAITLAEVAFGTGTGITSSNRFTFTIANTNLIVASASTITGLESSIIAGRSNIINSNSRSIILSSCTSCISGTSLYSSSIISSDCSSSNFRRSSIIAGYKNCMVGGSGVSNVMFGDCNRILATGGCGSCNSSILGGQCNNLSYSENSSILGGRCNSIRNSSCYSSTIGGRGNIIATFSRWASIVGGISNCIYGRTNTLATSDDSVIIGGSLNRILCSEDNAIIGGFCNLISGGPTGSWFSTIVGGKFNCISCESEGNSIIGGSENAINSCSYDNTIISGNDNQIKCYIGYSSIISGQCNSIYYAGDRNSIIGGYKNEICYFSFNTTIIGGCNSLSYYARQSNIIGGTLNTLCTTQRSVIIGGTGNSITNSCNSVVLGGQGLLLNLEDDVVYSSCLKLSTASNDNSVDKILVWDTSDNYVKYRDDSSISGGSIPAGILGSTPYYTGSSWTYSNTNIFNSGSRVGIGTQSVSGTPSSTLQVFGSLSLPIRTMSSSGVVGINDFTIIWTGGSGTVSLPKADLAPNRLYAFKTSGSPFDILASSGEAIIAINSGSYYTLPSKGSAVIIQSDGIDTWYVISDAF
jgi:hypothetical protein